MHIFSHQRDAVDVVDEDATSSTLLGRLVAQSIVGGVVVAAVYDFDGFFDRSEVHDRVREGSNLNTDNNQIQILTHEVAMLLSMFVSTKLDGVVDRQMRLSAGILGHRVSWLQCC